MLFPREQYTSTRISGGKQSIIATSSLPFLFTTWCSVNFCFNFPKYADLLLKIANISVAFLKVNSNFARKYFVCNKLSHQNNPLQFPSRIPMCFNPHFALNPQILQAVKKRKRFFHLNPVFYLTVLLKFCSVSFLAFTGWRDKFFFWWCHKCEPTFCTSPASQDQGPSTLLTLISLFWQKRGKSKEVEIWEQMQLIQILMLQLIFAKGKWILKYQVPCFTMDICT